MSATILYSQCMDHCRVGIFNLWSNLTMQELDYQPTGYALWHISRKLIWESLCVSCVGHVMDAHKHCQVPTGHWSIRKGITLYYDVTVTQNSLTTEMLFVSSTQTGHTKPDHVSYWSMLTLHAWEIAQIKHCPTGFISHILYQLHNKIVHQDTNFRNFPVFINHIVWPVSSKDDNMLADNYCL